MVLMQLDTATLLLIIMMYAMVTVVLVVFSGGKI